MFFISLFFIFLFSSIFVFSWNKKFLLFSCFLSFFQTRIVAGTSITV